MTRNLPRVVLCLLVGTAWSCGNSGGLRATAPSLELSSRSLDFGPVEELTTNALVLQLQNKGLAPLHLTARLAPDSSADFEVGTLPAELAVGDSRDLSVYFHPQGAGSDSGTLVLESDDPENPKIEVALLGGPIAPKLAASPDPVDFKTGGLSTAAVTLSNDGLASLQLTSLAISGNGDFTVETPALPLQLKPHQQLPVTINYVKSPRTAEGVLEIGSDDPTGPRSVRLIPNPGSADPFACSRAPTTAADAFEPNNSLDAANPKVSSPASSSTSYSYDITLPAGDEDWFEIAIPRSGSNTSATAQITCLNWSGSGCGAPPSVRVELYYQDSLKKGLGMAPGLEGASDGKSGLAKVSSSGPISGSYSQWWYVGAKPSSTVCAGEVVNATLKITVNNN